MNIKTDLQIEMDRIRKEEKRLRKMIDHLPDGTFSCRRNNERDRWYKVTEEENDLKQKKGKRVRQFEYIPKGKADYAAKLAYKTYLCHVLEDLRAEEKAISACQYQMEHHCRNAESYMSNAGISRVLSPVLEKKNSERAEWLKSPYQKNAEYPEGLTIPTISGVYVRSKSEALIANLLTERKIPFRYECALSLGRKIYYPDFTIRSPLDDRIVLWEHFGMLNVMTYQAEFWSKMGKYISSGYLPYYNLILTYETNETPFDISAADRLIRMMFER